MLTEQQIKEQLSIAYVHAVAAYAGFAVERTDVDMDSIDVTIKGKGRLDEASILYSPKIELQLKATSSIEPDETELSFPLPIKNYDDLRVERPAIPRLLVVLVLPDDRTQWINHSAEDLIMKKCAYWLNLKGAPSSDNVTNKTVKIPICNIFSPESLRELMVKTSKEEEL